MANATIVPTTTALLDLEEHGPEGLSRALGAKAPPQWPPEFNDGGYRQWQRLMLDKWSADPGFAGYYLLADGELVGTCGFKGPPTADGAVEIGYSIIPSRQRRGYASAGVALLIERAFADPRVTEIIAETLPEGVASQRVLVRCGFQRSGTRQDPDDGDVVGFVLRR